MDAASAVAEAFLLKIVFGEQVYRVRLNQKLDFAYVQEVLQEFWPGPDQPRAKYEDEEGDLCTLVAVTFTDFLDTAQPWGSCQLLRLILSQSAAESVEPAAELVEEMTPKKYQLDAQVPHCSSPPNSLIDRDEQEALALEHRAKLACQQILANHLQEWLASEPPSVRYEAWLHKLHPENCKDGVVDSRMYLEASVHRQLWNTIAAGAEDLADEERRRLLVAPVSDDPAPAQPSQQASDHGADKQPYQVVASKPAPRRDASTRQSVCGQAKPLKFRRASTRRCVGLDAKVKYRLASWASISGLGYIPYL